MLELADLRLAMEQERICTHHIPANGRWRPAENIPILITQVWTDYELRRFGNKMESDMQTAIEYVWIHDQARRPYIMQRLSTIRACIVLEEKY